MRFTSPILRLPLEMHLAIIEEAGTGPNTIARMAAVCRLWRDIVAHYLPITHVLVRSETALTSLNLALDVSTALCPVQPLDIRSVSITVGGIPWSGVSPDAAATLLHQLPNLFELHVVQERFHPSSALGQLRCDKLEALYLDDRSTYDCTDKHPLLQALPSLKVLSMDKFYGAWTDVADAPFALEQLRIRHLCVDTLPWLLSGSGHSLTVLDLGDSYIYREVMQRIVSDHGSKLLSLAVGYWTRDDDVQELRSCVALKELVFRGGAPTAACLNALPPTLTHISFDHRPTKPVCGLQKITNWPRNLLAVTYSWADDRSNTEATAKFCASRSLAYSTSTERIPPTFLRQRHSSI